MLINIKNLILEALNSKIYKERTLPNSGNTDINIGGFTQTTLQAKRQDYNKSYGPTQNEPFFKTVPVDFQGNKPIRKTISQKTLHTNKDLK